MNLCFSPEHIFILISLKLKLGVHHVSLLHGGPPRSCRCKFGILFDGFAKPGFLRRKIAPPGEPRTQDSSISLSSSYGRTRRERRKNWGLFNQKKKSLNVKKLPVHHLSLSWHETGQGMKVILIWYSFMKAAFGKWFFCSRLALANAHTTAFEYICS